MSSAAERSSNDLQSDDLSADESGLLRILVSRPDRLGDVLLSTPTFEVIKKNYPKSRLTVLVRANVAPLFRKLSTVDEVLVYEPEGAHSGLRGFFRILTQLKRRKIRIFIALQSNRKIAVAAFFGRIRYRVGPLSKIHSFLLYNRGVRQHRSLVEMHEADYNLQLLRRIGIRIASRQVLTRISVPDSSIESARQWLGAKGWDLDHPRNKLVAIHPGMGGSALNWPESHYLDLIRALVRDGVQILLTGGVIEGPLLERFKKALEDVQDKVWFYGGPGAGPIGDLAALFMFADLVVAPSTGPLHLAVALQKRVVTFFAPIRVQSALRWGPYLMDEGRASVLVPENYCGQDFKCKGPVCNYYPCMKSLTVAQALEQVRKQLKADV